MKLKITLITLLSAFILSSCGQSKTESETAQAEQPVKETNAELKTVLTGYLDVKNALVSDDAAKAKAAATSLAASAGEYSGSLNQTLQAISSTEDIEAQRAAFEQLSIAMYDLAKDGSAGITLYKQYCPMAFDDKGAFWLSDNKEVLNPFFGSAMLRCGSVKETIN